MTVPGLPPVVIPVHVVDASHPIQEATDLLPALSVPRCPQPTSLLAGEVRAEDGGVRVVSEGYTPESGPPG